MKPTPPKLPGISFPEGKPDLTLDHLSDIAELSKEYLKPEAAEFSEEELSANLRSLWHLSKQENSKISKHHSKKIEKILISAFGMGSRPANRSPQSESGGGAASPEKKNFSAAHSSSHQGSEGIIVSQQATEVAREKTKEEERKEKKNILKKTGEYAKRQWYLAKAKHYENKAINKHANIPSQPVSDLYAIAADFYGKAGKPKKEAKTLNLAGLYAQDVEQTIQYSTMAEEIYIKLNLPEEVVKMYMRLGNGVDCAPMAFAKVVGFCLNMGWLERASELNQYAIENINVYYSSPLQYCEEVGKINPELGVAAYLVALGKNHLHDYKAKCYSGLRELYDKLEQPLEVARMSEKAANNTSFAIKSERYNETKKLYLKAGKHYEAQGEFDKAAAAYDEMAAITDDYEIQSQYRAKAGELYEKANRPRMAAGMYVKAANTTSDQAKKTEYYQEATRLLGQYEAQCIAAGRPQDAADAYIKAANNTNDRELKLQYYAKAGPLFEQAGEFTKAADAYLNAAYYTNDQELESQYYAKAGNCYKQAGEFTKAAEAYIQALVADKQHIIASLPFPLNEQAVADSILALNTTLGTAFASGLVSGALNNPGSKEDFLAVSGWFSENYAPAKEVEETSFFFQNYQPKCGLSVATGIINAGFRPDTALALMSMDVQWSAGEIKSLRELLPPGGEVSKNKYTRAVFMSFIQNNAPLQVEIIRSCISRTEKFNKGDDERLLQVMSFAHSLGADFAGPFGSSDFSTMPKAVKVGCDIASKNLSPFYSRALLRKTPADALARWLSVFPEFEQTMKIHHDEDLIPPMRVLATVELLGMREGFAKHDPKVAEYLQTKLEKLFPNKDEQQAIREYLDGYASMDDEKLIFATDDLSKIREKLATWSSPTKVDHVLSEVSIRDRLLEAQQKLDDIFYKNHFSEEFIQIAGLHEDAPTMKALSEQFRELKENGASKSELDAIRQQQDSIRKWSKLQIIFQNYQQKFDLLNADIENAGKKLAPYKDMLEKWGFDYGDSFGNKVFTGELRLLSERCKSELAKNPKDERIAALSGEIADFEKACGNANSYVADLADRLRPVDDKKSGILDDLQAKKAWSERLISELEGGLSEKEGLGRIHDGQEPLYNIISAKENIDKAELIDILRRYTETTAINDLEHIVSMARNESSTQNLVYTYSAQQDFSGMELAMVGQCLDYRYRRNSIGNAPFTVSYQDSWRQMVVAYLPEDTMQMQPKVDSIIFLAQVESNRVKETSVVTDGVYVPDGSERGWSKVEGHIRFAWEKAKELGMPLVVPACTGPGALLPYFPQIKELAQEFGVKADERSVKVLVQPGPSKATYCELAGYEHYEENTELEVNALVLNWPPNKPL